MERRKFIAKQLLLLKSLQISPSYEWTRAGGIWNHYEFTLQKKVAADQEKTTKLNKKQIKLKQKKAKIEIKITSKNKDEKNVFWKEKLKLTNKNWIYLLVERLVKETNRLDCL